MLRVLMQEYAFRAFVRRIDGVVRSSGGTT